MTSGEPEYYTKKHQAVRAFGVTLYISQNLTIVAGFYLTPKIIVH